MLQPLHLLALDVIQLVAHVVVHELQLRRDGAVADLLRVGGLELLAELGVALEDGHDLLQVAVVLHVEAGVVVLLDLGRVRHGVRLGGHGRPGRRGLEQRRHGEHQDDGRRSHGGWRADRE